MVQWTDSLLHQTCICASNLRLVYFSLLLEMTYLMTAQTRMMHIKPAELLLPTKALSKPTEKMLTNFAECVFASVL
jgi:hypothetical protein